MARWNAVWFGGVRQVGWGEAMSVKVRIGVVRQVRRGYVSPVEVWCDMV